MSTNILENTIKYASYNVIFQIFLRCITFCLNAFLLRFISKDVLGVMNVRLLLLESTILFLSNEAFRKAALSQNKSHTWRQVINLMWLTVPLSIVICLIFSFIWLQILSVPSKNVTPHYKIGVWCIAISCVIEMFAEPMHIVSLAFSFSKLKIVLESTIVLIRTLIFTSWIVFDPEKAIIAFSVAQIVANSLYSMGYYIFFYLYLKKRKNKICNKTNFSQEKSNISNNCNKNQEKIDLKAKICKSEKKKFSVSKRCNLAKLNESFPFTSILDFLPQFHEDQNCIHPNSAYLTWSFFKQGIVKQILTEGERYIMTLFSVMSFKEQGIYDVVNNLGSVIPRFLFRPVEDALYLYFTQSIERDVKLKNQSPKRIREVSTVLHQTLHCLADIGLLICIFGQNYSTLLLYLYGGESFTTGEAPNLMKAQSFLVFLLGINGISECYVFSTMTAQQLNKYNYIMAVFSLAFLFISWNLTKIWGSIGFIFANCFNMITRIIYSCIFIWNKYADTCFHPLYGLMPKKYFLINLSLTLFITKFTETYCSSFQHVCTGFFCFVSLTLTWILENQEFSLIIIKKLSQIKKKQ